MAADRWARVEGGEVVELRKFFVAPDPNPAKGLDWRPCPKVQRPVINGMTHVAEGPVYVVSQDAVTETWNVREKTEQEISADKDAAVASLNGGYGPLIRALFNLHNRIRALEGQPEHTMNQFRQGLKALL